MIVETVLQKKGTEVATMTLEATVADAAALLPAEHVGIVVVCDAEQKVVGVVTDSDIMRCVARCKGEKCTGAAGIGNAMTRDVVTCKPVDGLREVWTVMSDHGLRRIPVINNDGKLSGIINLRDIYWVLSDEKQLEAHELELFIAPPVIRGEHMTDVLETLHEEHRRIGAVLECLHHLVAGFDDVGSEAEINLLTAILDYMEAFPDTIHHPKEETYLFETLRRRKPGETELLDHLIDEHTVGKRLLSDLRLALQALHNDPSSLERFRLAVNSYVDFECAHMRREENVFMPLAARYLKTEDWSRIDKAFSRDADPLFGEERRATFDKLFTYIVEHDPDAQIVAVPVEPIAKDRTRRVRRSFDF